ncbi:endonuclease/exonuclease/phosphatase family protein [Nocardioides caldifontis]|uniref:endonuclease/exonuclease/phosphatase family protein n=1 Tax=Nocardioides caldifontis TaxID=2588938 RepID=UPI0011E03BBE|nr:endonuclease/exonuclease/phosphatase family protein [Nocardioides caldifontis]
MGEGAGGAAGGATGLRVGTYNLYLGADLLLLLGDRTPAEIAANREEVRRQLEATAFPGRVDAVARLLVDQRLDLVGLQEVCRWEVDGALLWDFAELLTGALAGLGEPYDVVVADPTFSGSGTLELDGAPVRLGLTGSNAVLRRRGARVEVVSTSTGRFREALRLTAMGETELAIGRGWCAARCRVAGGGELVFATTHTEAHDEGSRDVQRDELVALLPGDGTPTVLVGDFNAPPDRVGMPAGLVDAWVAAGHGTEDPAGVTSGQAADLRNEESWLHQRIDYVWVRGLAVEECHRFGAEPEDRTGTGLWPSDHAGVAATVVMPTRQARK